MVMERAGVSFPLPPQEDCEALVRALREEDFDSLVDDRLVDAALEQKAHQLRFSATRGFNTIGVRFRFATRAALVEAVRPSSPAAIAGLREGDEIELINSVKVDRASRARLAIVESPLGEPILVQVLRDGVRLSLTVFPEVSREK